MDGGLAGTLAGAGGGRPPPRKGAVRTGRVSSGDPPPFLVRKQVCAQEGIPCTPPNLPNCQIIW